MNQQTYERKRRELEDELELALSDVELTEEEEDEIAEEFEERMVALESKRS